MGKLLRAFVNKYSLILYLQHLGKFLEDYTVFNFVFAIILSPIHV